MAADNFIQKHDDSGNPVSKLAAYCEDADTEEQKNALWKMRRAVGEAVKTNSIYKEEDTVVPRYELPVLLKGIKDIGNKYGFNNYKYWSLLGKDVWETKWVKYCKSLRLR